MSDGKTVSYRLNPDAWDWLEEHLAEKEISQTEFNRTHVENMRNDESYRDIISGFNDSSYDNFANYLEEEVLESGIPGREPVHEPALDAVKTVKHAAREEFDDAYRKVNEIKRYDNDLSWAMEMAVREFRD